MIELLFIRHGATAGNLRRRYIGRTDEPLCGEGIAQVETLRKQGLLIDELFVSPLLRTRQTADILFPKMPYTVVDGFAEMDFGCFEGKAADEVRLYDMPKQSTPVSHVKWFLTCSKSVLSGM